LPNGARINLGAYGGTEEASKSPTGRVIIVVSPNGGEVWRGVQTVRWLAVGQDWAYADTVTILCSSNSGGMWSTVTGATGILARTGEFDVNLSGLGTGTQYRIAIVCDHAPSATDMSDADFSIVIGGLYYVNDTNTTGDVYCTAPGDDGNDGRTPATPKATVQAILDFYDLGTNDNIFVDAGLYQLTNNITVGAADGGALAGKVRIIGVKGKTVFDRAAPSTSGSACVQVNATSVAVENIVCRNAYYGIYLNGGSDCAVRNNSVSGCGYSGVQVYRADNTAVENNLILHNGSEAAVRIKATYLGEGCYDSLSCEVRNNTILASGSDGIRLYANGGPIIKNNIVQANGSGKFCINAYDVRAVTECDYNDLLAGSGAKMGKIYELEGGDMIEWRAIAGWDGHSLCADPLFADAAGGDYHLKSAAGRYDPSTGKPPSDPTAWTNDTETSLVIDAGNPDDPEGLETTPNGARLNIGADGGTLEASRSPAAARIVNLLAPNGGQVWNAIQPLELRVTGTGWASNDTLRIEYCTESSGDWQLLAGGASMPSTSSRFWWDTRTVPNAYGYRFRATCVQDASVVDISDGYIAVANPGAGNWSLHVASTGNDDFLHGIPSQPFHTVGYALNIAEGSSGATVDVRVAAGTYQERVTLKPYVNLLGAYAASDWTRDIAANETVLDGGASGAVITAASNTTIEGFSIVNGRAGQGGGIVCNGVSPSIRYNRICRNVATAYGGGIYVYDAMPTIANNMIVSNDASYGDGIYINSGSPSVINNTLFNNTGSGIYKVNSGTPSVVNCILWGNGDDLYGVTATYSDIEDSDTGTGNIHTNPMLTTNYHLRVSSPCIDAGDDSVVLAGWTDIDGQPRVRFAHVDIGAHESTLPRDSDEDGLPDWWMTNCFGHATGLTNDRSRAQDDADGDGMINSAEYTADTHPTNRESVLSLIGITPETGGLRIDWKGGIQATQYVEYRPTLTGTTETRIVIYTNLPPTPITNFVIDAGATNATLFYRIKAGR
ncbi:MAG: right-handed parallel beta-helix repeat-containing protein, partial [bacterium]